MENMSVNKHLLFLEDMYYELMGTMHIFLNAVEI